MASPDVRTQCVKGLYQFIYIKESINSPIQAAYLIYGSFEQQNVRRSFTNVFDILRPAHYDRPRSKVCDFEETSVVLERVLWLE